MTHEEYTKAIEKQQSLINRLFFARKKRSLAIKDIVKERYGELVGKFFKGGERVRWSSIGGYYYIIDVCLPSLFAMTSEVEILLVCRHFGTIEQLQGDGMKIVGVEFSTNSFRFTPYDDLISILEPTLVDKEEVMTELNRIKDEFTENFLKTCKRT